ncbi:lipopolysaccharide kinase InaA family protein [Moheibacter sediminis]|uniref:Lipopolysaccharide kinase (Kdo/WaaP) family protein n=1 Tax=Moheibacter sediminis TaxID=1434700 RepID=A0A1W1ZNC4_9FLAO|nr:lipopolysaccharide kinase InaA family protein [Moheibacter sediminis]SMC49884.1 Lipopolysaccharide kinase (Kdo/WaaP) family protein [Moheibacter sediminis]
MIFEINTDFKPYEKEIHAAFQDFENSGVDFIIGKRNKIKLFQVNQNQMNVKSFKIPNKINQFIYKYFRKSKARRSFEYANILLKKGIGTPSPIAFQENYNAFGLQKSFYASAHQEYDLTFRELVEIKDYPDEESILRQFTKFCFKMHEAGIEFKDHSPGNTLIKKSSDGIYEFFLVDLNRMNFHDFMSIELRMKNLSRLTPKKEMVKIITDEYARISGENSEKLLNLLWKFTSEFQTKYHRKHNAKNKLKSLFK